jgi:arylsulfatase A-like enzyme
MNFKQKYPRLPILKACLLAAGLLTVQAVSAQKKQKPNIVLVLVDDLGFSDIGPFGATEIETPNLDKLAAGGLKLKEFYNNSICAPTRASLLTGQYQHKAGVGFFNNNLGLAAYQGFLNRESLTLAEVLKSGGYTTLMAGKWHVGDDRNQWPNQRGFDHFFGFIGGASNYYEIGEKGTETVPLVKDNEPYFLEPGKYLTEEITNNALGFLDDQQKAKKPFFLYLAYNAPHWPLQALPADIAKYKGKYKLGWDSLRVQRYRNAIKKGLILLVVIRKLPRTMIR